MANTNPAKSFEYRVKSNSAIDRYRTEPISSSHRLLCISPHVYTHVHMPSQGRQPHKFSMHMHFLFQAAAVVSRYSMPSYVFFACECCMYAVQSYILHACSIKYHNYRHRFRSRYRLSMPGECSNYVVQHRVGYLPIPHGKYHHSGQQADQCRQY